MSKKSTQANYADIKPWVKIAVAQEGAKPADPLWKDEPSTEKIAKLQQQRIRFLRKHGKTDPRAKSVAERLASCHPRRRCRSGACLQCKRLLQRWFVRGSKRFIATHLENEKGDLVAISIVPASSIMPPGQLQSLSIRNFYRRIKYALGKAGIEVGVGGIDFSFNEDREGRYQPFWTPHLYVITSARNKKLLKKELTKCFPGSVMTPRPIKISPFQNTKRRRSYALKTYFVRRIGYNQTKKIGNQVRKCRNTSRDKLRAGERLELFLFLDRIGLAMRPFFLGVKPHVSSKRVRLLRMG